MDLTSFGIGVPLLINLYHLAIALLPIYPFLWAAVVVLVRVILSKLPAAQQVALEHNALKVVQAVEQSANGLPGTDKKATALGLLEQVCKASGIKFDPALAEMVIESTVFGFNQAKDVVIKLQPTTAPVAA